MEDDVLLLARILGARVAERLLRRFGSLHELLHADRQDVLSCRGIGRARADAVRALPELARR